MNDVSTTATPGEGHVTDAGHALVRYWAAARAAVGLAEERVGVPSDGVPLLHVLAGVTAERDARVAQVVALCSVLLDERAVHPAQAGETLVRPGAVIDLLPPFAGG